MGRPGRSQVSPRTVWTVGLNALAVVGFGLILYQLRSLLMFLACALMLALALNPLVQLFEKRGLKRGWGVLLAVLCVLGFCLLIGISVVPMLVDQVRSLVEALPGFIAQVSKSQWLRSLDARFGVVKSAEHSVAALPSALASPALGVLSSTVNLLVTGVALLTVSLFALLSGRQLFEDLLHWVKPERRPEVRSLALEMRAAVSGYLVGVGITCAMGAVAIGGFTFVLGVPYFLALGLMYLVLGFIPYIGSLLVAIAVSLTTLATVGFRRALIALALCIVYQQLEGNLLQPLIQRRTLQMNPLLISIVVIAGAMLMGVLGAVLALPFAAALQVLLRRVQQTRRARWRVQSRPPGPTEPGPRPEAPRTREDRDTGVPPRH